MDIAYTLVEDIINESSRLVQSIQTNNKDDDLSSLEKFNKEVNKNYESWSDVYHDIYRLDTTHLKVGALQILDFIKFSKYYEKSFRGVIFDESEFDQARSFYYKLSDILKVLYDKKGTPIIYRKLNWVPNYFFPTDKLESILNNTILKRFSRRRPNSPWDYLYHIITDSFEHTQERFTSTKISRIKRVLTDIKKMRDKSFSEKIYEGIKECKVVYKNNKGLFEEIEKHISKLKVTDVIPQFNDGTSNWYMQLWHKTDRLLSSLIGIYYDNRHRDSFHLPKKDWNSRNDSLNHELLIEVSRKFGILTLDEAVESINLLDEFVDYSLEKNVVQYGLTKKRLRTFKEVNPVIKKNLEDFKRIIINEEEGSAEEILEKRLNNSKSLISIIGLSYFMSFHKSSDVSRWKEMTDYIDKKLSKEKIVWEDIKTVNSYIKGLTQKTFLLNKEDDIGHDEQIFESTEISEHDTDINSMMGDLEKSINEFYENVILLETSEEYLPLVSEHIHNTLMTTVSEMKDPITIESEILKKLIKIQRDIDKIELPKKIQPGNYLKRVQKVKKNIKSLYYEEEPLQKWIGVLEEAVSLETPLNIFYHKNKLGDIKELFEGQNVWNNLQKKREKIRK